MPRPALPELNWAGLAHAVRSNQRSIVRSKLERLPFLWRLGRSPPPPAEFDTPAAKVAVNVSPVGIVQMPVMFQLPMRWLNAPLETNWGPFPNGSSQLWLTTAMWLRSSGMAPHSQAVQRLSCGAPLPPPLMFVPLATYI